MTKTTHPFQPNWRTEAPADKSWRSIFKWGAPDEFKHPNPGLYALLKESFGLEDNDFKARREEGDEAVTLSGALPPGLSETQVKALETIVGAENINSDDYTRVRFSYGKTMEELYDLRSKTVDHLCDLVVHPRNVEDVKAVVRFADQEKIPVYVYGGGSSVTLGLRPVKGGITLAMSTHMNRILSINETNQTVTVESGILGPALEEGLNHAPERFNTRFAYTCGHSPQSFEFSSVGGWIVTKGSGQQSSYYGDACDLLVSQEVVTPRGTITTLDYPATATGPLVNDIMKGSEGAFGVLTRVTLKLFRHMPENRKRFSFIFPDWGRAVSACRTIAQGEFGMPSVLRISDAEETLVGLKQHGIEGGLLDRFITARGYRTGDRCLMIGHTEGEKGFSRNVYRKVRNICKANGGMSLTAYPVKKWEKSKFKDPYMREDLNDFGITIDTLETGVTWDRLHAVHEGVRALIKERPRTVCMTHCSHFYPQGTNLYFIFLGTFENKVAYKQFQERVIDRIESCGGSLSHHHGVGKMISPWMERHLGGEQMAVLKALKRHFDPSGIMNPGGTLGLD